MIRSNARAIAKEHAKAKGVWVFARTLEGGLLEFAVEQTSAPNAVDVYAVADDYGPITLGAETLVRSYALPRRVSRKSVLLLNRLVWVGLATAFSIDRVGAGDPWWSPIIWAIAGLIGLAYSEHGLERIDLLLHFRHREGWQLAGRPPFEMNDW